MTIDDAEWHLDSVLDRSLDRSAAAVHIGVFLAWASRRGLLDSRHSGVATDLELRAGTPAQFAHQHFVAQFATWDLTTEGQRFAQAGYRAYLSGMSGVPALAEHEDSYLIPDSWDSHDAIAPWLDQLYGEWRASIE
ncbi:hypothetical protein [Gordonia hongkongensis]|uniref:DUF7832 domain-containing protein n=1 Tax=Gordonia hongkongensis TaxID=1701090 RepID=UPI003D754E4A